MPFCLKKRLLIEKPIVNTSKKVLWFHCASVGEFNTLKPILREFKRDFYIVLTYFSPRARDYLKGMGEFYDLLYPLPLDIPPLMRSFEKRVKPSAIVVMERELWLSLFRFTKAPKVLINSYAKGGLRERVTLKGVSLVIARTEEDGRKFREAGVERVEVCGNLKMVWEGEEPPSAVDIKGKVFVAGSTREGEEVILLNAFKKLKGIHEDLKMVLAPRHVSRADEVEKLAKDTGFRTKRLSEGITGDWDVLVVDVLGRLREFYKVADVTFVGGTLVPIGGHNVLEPAHLGKPVLFGLHTEKVRDMADLLRAKGYGFPVGGADDVVREVDRILKEGFSPRESLREVSERVKECYLNTLRSYLEQFP